MDLTFVEFLLGLAASVAVGALVGIEREHRRDRTKVYAGVRTFPLIAATGYLAAVLGQPSGALLAVAVGFGVVGLSALAFFYVRSQTGEIGFTTPMAFVVTYLAGVLIGRGLLLEGVVVAVMTTALLLTKRRLHRLAEALTEGEMMGALQFVALAFIALPLAATADGPYLGGLVGQGRAIDLRWMVFVVVAVSAISFVSFLALRQLGSRKGLTVAGGLGGAVNSQAATVGAAALAKNTRGLEVPASAAVLAAAGTALVRDGVIVALADPSLRFLEAFAPILVLPLVVAAVATYLKHRRIGQVEWEGSLGVESPFALRPAVVFALVFTGVNAGAFFLQDLLGPIGVYATAVGGIISSGAVLASAANLVFTGTIPLHTGIVTAGLAVILSLLSRLVALAVVNRSILGHVTLPILLVAGALGLGVLVLL